MDSKLRGITSYVLPIVSIEQLDYHFIIKGLAVNNSIDLDSMVGQASRLPDRTRKAADTPAPLTCIQSCSKQRRVVAFTVAFSLLSSFGCSTPEAFPEPTPLLSDPVADQDGPELETIPISEPQPIDQPLIFSATAEDPSGIYVVFLHLRPQNSAWIQFQMEWDALSGDYLTTVAPDQLLGAGSVSYYLEAADGTAYHNVTWLPPGGDEEPYKFNLVQ